MHCSSKSTMKWGEYISDFNHGMLVGARWTALDISESVNLLGFQCAEILRI